MVVVLHVGQNFSKSIPEHLQRACSIVVKEAEHNEPLKKGHVYFAPPGYHLLVSPRFECELNVDEPVMFSRPAIDVLFESVGDFYGSDATGIILSGANSDGAKGLKMMEEKNAQIIVQSPQTATFREMPESAIALTNKPQVLDVQALGCLLAGSEIPQWP